MLSLSVLTGVIALVAMLWLLGSRPSAVAAHPELTAPTMPADPSAGSSASGLGAAASSSSPALVVDVVGRVRRPGVYRLATGARVLDAVHAAGGMLPGVAPQSVNLAARVSDGQLIAVGIAVAADPGAPPATGASAASGPVDLNTAGAEQLDALPGVGPVLAQHILDYRAAHGAFRSVDQLTSVAGIGPAKFATLRGLVTV